MSWMVWAGMGVFAVLVVAAALALRRERARSYERRVERAAEWQRLLTRWQQPPARQDPPTGPMPAPGRHSYPPNLPGDRQ
jgi:hypothetical protein